MPIYRIYQTKYSSYANGYETLGVLGDVTASNINDAFYAAYGRAITEKVTAYDSDREIRRAVRRVYKSGRLGQIHFR